MAKSLLLRLPADGTPSAARHGHDARNAGDGNLLPSEMCASSFARACAARRSLLASASSSPSGVAKKPRHDIARDSAAVPLKAAAPLTGPSPTQELPLLLINCRVLDPAGGAYLRGLQRVMLRGGVISSVEVMPGGADGDGGAAGSSAAGAGPRVDEQVPAAAAGAAAAAAAAATAAAVVAMEAAAATAAVVVDCGGAVLMPGLCDAHVHCTAVTANLAGLMSLPESYVAAKSAHILAGMLARGFTTVRDAGGADFGLAQAVEEGLVLGPKILFTGHALSQTGGHGDFRGGGEDLCACGVALRGIGRVCDGDAEVRRAARDELRRGAHCIKIMASGGVASPTDRLTNSQFSESELRAITEEAQAAGTYVCAHAYTPPAIRRAVQCGARSIEHGNYLDEPTAQLMAEKGVFLVPTLVTYQELARGGATAGMPQELVAKVGDAVEVGLKSLAVAQAAGVVMCFGSDLLGELHPAQAAEFELRSRVLPPADIVRSATTNCAALFGLEFTLGRVRPGYRADLLLLSPGVDPLADSAALAAPGGAAVAAVFKEGLLAKAPRPPRTSSWAAVGAAIIAPGGGSSSSSGSGSGADGALGEGRGLRPEGDWGMLNERLFPSGFWPSAS